MCGFIVQGTESVLVEKAWQQAHKRAHVRVGKPRSKGDGETTGPGCKPQGLLPARPTSQRFHSLPKQRAKCPDTCAGYMQVHKHQGQAVVDRCLFSSISSARLSFRDLPVVPWTDGHTVPSTWVTAPHYAITLSLYVCAVYPNSSLLALTAST